MLQMRHNILTKIKKSLESDPLQPLHFNVSEFNADTIKDLQDHQYVYKVIDLYNSQSEELRKLGWDKSLSHDEMEWVYFPWSRVLIRLLSEEKFCKLRLTRNQLLMNDNEEDKFYHFTVAIIGLSVGSSIATTLVLHGGGKNTKIIDPDILTTSNLNRIRVSLSEIGSNKADITAQQMYQINPYININIYRQKLSYELFDEFFQSPKVDVIVDEMDDFPIKVKLRRFASEKRIPVIMATDSEDSVILDVERYDIDHNYPPFHGLLSTKDIQMAEAEHSIESFIHLGKKFIGEENMSQRMLDSLLHIGKGLGGVPQLATASLAAGSITVKAIRDIALEREKSSYRRFIHL